MRKTASPGRSLAWVVLIAWSLTTIYPFFWVIINSFKPTDLVIRDSFNFPRSPTLDNYRTALNSLNVGRSYLNSCIMTGTTVICVAFMAGLAAYALARLKLRFRNLVKSLLLLSMLIPGFSTIIALYSTFNTLGILNTYLSLILVHTAGNLSFAVLVLANYMATVPQSVEEAAFLDGAKRLTIFSRIFVPISVPAFATVMTFTFMWSYNDLFSALILVNQARVRPISVLMSMVSSQFGTDFGFMTAAVVMVVVPVLLLYLFLQKNIIAGLTAGAIKG